PLRSACHGTPIAMAGGMHAVRRALGRWWEALRDWAWGPLLIRAVIWIGAFVALAQVGRGAYDQLAVPNASASAPPPADRSEPKPPPPPAPPQPCPSSSAPGLTPDGKVILNTASVRDLTRLPGVGERRAQDIVAMRTRLGRFRT